MNNKTRKQKNTTTPYIQINTKKCVACWECYGACTHQVIGRINLPWHKHVKIRNGENCTGCLKCLKTCKEKAIESI